jgi:hypothetical protein
MVNVPPSKIPEAFPQAYYLLKRLSRAEIQRQGMVRNV